MNSSRNRRFTARGVEGSTAMMIGDALLLVRSAGSRRGGLASGRDGEDLVGLICSPRRADACGKKKGPPFVGAAALLGGVLEPPSDMRRIILPRGVIGELKGELFRGGPRVNVFFLCCRFPNMVVLSSARPAE